MKILAIRGRNLASLEGNFEIDFRCEPLHSAGIFAITGTTGSGKSTILDAMCIALYETSPRLDNVRNSTFIERKGTKGVSENSPKTILRRGAHEGWAEVDFLAINGHEYRVRWSVSRTNNSAEGTFRETSYDLTDLTTGEYSKLTSKSHKQVIPALIGLTFEQFTRAVLLAQGNFAAFLKAEESEKASILEKLSGTEIYSLISAGIYKRYSEAKAELEKVEERKKGLEILSTEALEALVEEKVALQLEHDEHERRKSGITAKIEWRKRLEQLEKDLSAAEDELAKANGELLSAAPVKEKLDRIDRVQKVRDSYTALRNGLAQIKEDEVQISLAAETLNIKKGNLEEAAGILEKASQEQEKAAVLAAGMQPKIIEAGKAEKSVSLIEKRVAEQRGGIIKAENERSACTRNILDCRNALAKLDTEEKRINEWFGENMEFEAALPLFPSIIANIGAQRNAGLLIGAKKRSLTAAQALLREHEEQLAKAVEQQKVLDGTMSSEIATLRGRLVNGEPCPVCGSRRHEVVELALNVLEEKELEKAKETNRMLTEHLKENITHRRSEIDKLTSAIEIHAQSAAECYEKNMEYLRGVTDAAALLAREDAVERLTALSATHAGYKERISVIAREKEVHENSIGMLGKQLAETEKEIEEKAKEAASTAKDLKEAQEQLNLLKGSFDSAEKMQEYCNMVVKRANENFSTAVEKRNAAVVECKRLEGLINEKENRLKSNRSRCKVLQLAIEEFIASHDWLTAELLAELVAVDAAMVAGWRNMVEQCRNAHSAATVKVAERRRNVNNHLLLETKPGEEETAEFLNESLTQIEEKQKGLFKEISRIAAVILKDEENNRLFAQYRDEYNKKREIAESWNNLNIVLGSQKGDKLMRLVQGYTLDILLNVANEHLKNIAPRYRLSRITHDKLAIKVMDLDVMSTARSVHSLSGGETFLVSLALSLALSSISSNRMSIETLFIDEGFGALDSETLKVAMRALEGLQNQGRKIGVISHLSEMLEQIPVKIRVVKKGLGKSRIEI